MGCVFSHREEELPAAVAAVELRKAARKFSWDRREKVIVKDFVIEGLSGGTLSRLPGTVEGQQFSIENCQDCNIYIFDNSSAVSVENCVNCRIFIGPVRSSAYLRNCSDCTVGLACQQFRARGCHKVDVHLCCTTAPNIETSTGITFSCLQYHYTALRDYVHVDRADQFNEAQLSVYNNNWGKIHDNSSTRNAKNYRLISESVRVDALVPSSAELCAEVDASADPDTSIVPSLPGVRTAPKDKSCLVMFFSDGLSHERAHTFIKRMKESHPECFIVQSREVYMQEEEAERVFGTDSYAMAVRQGPVIGLEYSGPQSCRVCQEMLIAVSKGSTGLVFVSANHDYASKQVESFFCYAELNVGSFTPQRVSSVKR